VNDIRMEHSASSAAPLASMHATFAAQRAAFLRAEAPTLQQRRADLTKLGRAIRASTDRLAAAISADFGHRSHHETELGEIVPVLSAIRHTLRHLRGWMRPKRVSVGLELLPGRARILYQPLGVVGIISPWNYPFQLAIDPLIAALAAGNRVMLKPSELTPRTADFLAELLAGLFAFD
jgi:coniferyl-aldehyde dehydrogenase